MWTTSATWNNLRLYFCDAVFVLHFTSSVAVLPGGSILCSATMGDSVSSDFSVLLHYRAALRCLAEHECPAYMYQQVLYVWELKFMHLSRTWDSALWFQHPDFYIIHCLIPNVSLCIHTSSYKHMCVSNIMQSKPLFFLRLLAALSVLWRLHQGGLCWAGNGWERGIWDFMLQDEDRYFIADALQQIMDYMEESLRFWCWWQWRLSTLMHI